MKSSRDKPFVPELQKADVDADAVLMVLIDGVAHRRVLRGTETYMTTLGPVTIERTLYKDRTDPAAKAVAALEARVGVIGGFWMPSAAKQATARPSKPSCAP